MQTICYNHDRTFINELHKNIVSKKDWGSILLCQGATKFTAEQKYMILESMIPILYAQITVANSVKLQK